MSDELPSRRDVLKVAAAVGAAALVSEAGGQVTAPANKASPIVGIQIGALPLSGDIDGLLDTAQGWRHQRVVCICLRT